MIPQNDIWYLWTSESHIYYRNLFFKIYPFLFYLAECTLYTEQRASAETMNATM